jgi:hypothetical protein
MRIILDQRPKYPMPQNHLEYRIYDTIMRIGILKDY